MAAAGVGAVVSYVLKKIDEEFLFLCHVDKEVRRLRDELQRMERFLEDADTRRDNDEAVKDWVKDVRRAAYQAEDLVELIALEEEKNRRRRRCFIGGSFFNILFPHQLLARHKFGREIDILMQRIDDIDKGKQRYGIANLSASDEGKRYVDEKIARRRRAVLHAPDSYVVGMEEEKKAILDLLLGNKEARRYGGWAAWERPPWPRKSSGICSSRQSTKAGSISPCGSTCLGSAGGMTFSGICT